MRVLFVGSHRADKQFSIVGFERALEREMQGRCKFEAIHPGTGWLKRYDSKWFRYVDKYVFFPRELRRRAKDVDLVHFGEKGLAVNLPHVKSRTTMATVHDLLAVKAARNEYSWWNVGFTGRRYQQMILRAESMADGLACVSETTHREVDHYLPGYKGEVRTILNGMYKTFKRAGHEQALASLDGEFKPNFPGFFFHIGGNKKYKNRAGVLRLYAEIRRRRPDLNLGLVMAGGSRTEELDQVQKELELNGSVQWVVEPSDAQIEAYYSLATALLFPSFAEGFGLPIIEAQSCGCPVFATDRAPMTEVGGDAAVYIDCEDVEKSAQKVLSHLDKLDELAQRGQDNVKRFDPSIMADAYMDFYRDLTDSGPVARN